MDQCVVPTTASALRRYFRPRRGVVVTMEEGALAGWLYRLLHNRVDEVFVCNPRYNRLLRSGAKNDRIDAAKLAELLRLGALRRVHHERTPVALRELVAHYTILVVDTMRVMHRISAALRSNGIATGGVNIYAKRYRRQLLRRIKPEAVRCRAEALYQQFDALAQLRENARAAMLDEAAQHVEFDLLTTIPFVGPIRAAELLAYLGGTRRFQRRGDLWSYAGLAVKTRSSGDHQVEDGRIVARPRFTRGLTRNFNPQLKRIFKDIATAGSLGSGPLRRFFDGQVQRGLSVPVARFVLARRVASAVRAMLRDGVEFDASRFSSAIGRLLRTGGKHQKNCRPTTEALT